MLILKDENYSYSETVERSVSASHLGQKTVSLQPLRGAQYRRHCGGNPLSGVTRPPGMSRGRVVNSHATPPYGGSVGQPSWGGVQRAQGHT